MTITTAQAQALDGRVGDVYDAAGSRIGAIGQIYLDEDTDTPAWVSVHTGVDSDAESLAPLHGAHLRGSDILIRYHRSQVEQAPRADPDDATLIETEERRLHHHYGIVDQAD